jgi:Raf kinase inhibitor-like YbhB/YbcL family protein
MQLFTSAFATGGFIPSKYTCDGANISPPLEWSDVPDGARSLALIVEDPDAPRGLFLHWLIYDLPASEYGLTEGIGIEADEAGGAKQGRNGFGKHGYGGPCPPGGVHRYFFRLYALDTSLDVPSGATREVVERAMRDHVIAEAEMMGRYQRAAGSSR